MAEYFISPTGAGDNSGSSAANAIAFNLSAGLLTWITGTAQPGDVLNMLAGDYQADDIEWPAANSGTAGNPITIRGVGTAAPDSFGGFRVPDFSSGWPLLNCNGGNWISFEQGASYITIEQLQITHCEFCYLGSDGGHNTIELKQHHLRQCREFFRMEIADAEPVADNILIENIYGTGHRKRVIHWDRVINSTVRYCSVTNAQPAGEPILDSSWPTYEIQGGPDDGKIIFTEDFPLHFRFGPGSTDDLVQDCYSAFASVTRNYYNGDSFITEEGTERITFTRCIGEGHGDSIFDTKGGPHTFNQCGGKNVGHRIFRMWDGVYTFNDCFAIAPHWDGIALIATGTDHYAAAWIRNGSATFNNLRAVNCAVLGHSEPTTAGVGIFTFNDSIFELGFDVENRLLQHFTPGSPAYIESNCDRVGAIRISSASSRYLREEI